MMYSEFVEGTGCKKNEYNYKVFRDLEIMYMNSDMTKQEIYEYGKKLVDNSKNHDQIEFEEKIKSEIKEKMEQIEFAKKSIEFYKGIAGFESSIIYYKNEIKNLKRVIKGLKWVIA